MSSEHPQDGAALRASDLDRSMAGTALDNAYADGELDNAEYHSRLEAATRAKTRGDLHALLGDLQVPHPLTELPAEPAPAPARRGSWGPIVLAVAIAIAIIVVVIVIVALPTGRTRSSRPASMPYGPATATASSNARPDYTPEDAALLQHLPAGYDQTNCYHQNPEPSEVAALHCDPHAGRLEAAFFLYPDAATLQQSYDNDRQSSAHTACADGAPDNAYSAGRYECILSNGAGVVPTIEFTSNPQNVLGVYFAAGPNDAAGLMNWWKQHNRLR
ncbi:DUF1707 SHOCT-like domain-containing protein [Nocardia sp. GAS34]|uniref:DUF1707 SHOCT-like domain-containing protein n=1 Tax=unclassified Nocardia TaxID=2637762 RepID=UPI003D1ED94E